MMSTKTNTLDPVSETENLVFTPMTEKQMAFTKGGTDIPPWLQELLDQWDDLLDYLDGLWPVDPDDINDDFWDELQEDLDEAGYVPLTPEELALDW